MSKRKYTNSEDINFNEFKEYFESHTRDETLKRFNIDIRNLQVICKSHNYTRPQNIVIQQRKEKYKQTCLEKYGVDSNMKLDSFIKHAHTDSANKKRRLSQEKYLVEHYGVHTLGELESVKKSHHTEKFSKSMKNAYNKLSKEQKEQRQEKIKKTCMDKYGVPYYTCTKDCKDASHTDESIYKANNSRVISCLEKYGVEHVLQVEHIKTKVRNTCLEKYGVDSYSKTLEFAKKRKQRYFYKDNYFDSSWELAYYIYNIDKGISIIREPVKLEYEYKGKKCYYFPDFKVNDKLIEIKGNQFFKDNDMINIYNIEDKQFSAKYKCAIANDVKFLKHEDVIPCLNYVKNTYGKDYLKSFRVGVNYD